MEGALLVVVDDIVEELEVEAEAIDVTLELVEDVVEDAMTSFEDEALFVDSVRMVEMVDCAKEVESDLVGCVEELLDTAGDVVPTDWEEMLDVEEALIIDEADVGDDAKL